MNAGKTRRLVLICLAGFCSALPGATGGCAKPNQANIELRKRIEAMETDVATAKRVHEADIATIRALQEQQGSLPTLPQERLDKLFTVHGISLGRLTGGADLDPSTPGDGGIKVYVVPIDQTGQPLKAAGSFVVEAFDLDKPGDNLVGRWQFNTEQARNNWFGRAMLYTYVLSCPWQRPGNPQHSDLTLKVSFRDELTGREFTAQRVIKVNTHVQRPSG